MPKKQQTISIQNLDTDTALAIAYEAFINLGWQPQFAGPDKLLGVTPKKITAYGQQIIIEVAGAELNISSETTASQTFDLGGKNKKNLADFINAFQSLEQSISIEKIEENKANITILREETQRVAEESAQQNAEVDAVMNLSQSNLYVTYTIIAINLLVFIIMAVNGVSLFAPSGVDIIKWGGNFGPLTVSGEWWRLLTNVFVHIGVIHVAFNMYALYMVGIYLEPMLGKIRFLVAYICTGIIASIASLWWHSSNPTASAGASGAIFGLYGVFLALLSTNLIPKKVRIALLQSIGIFVVYNLVYGLKSGIDNAAHLGGLVSGLVVGYVFYFTLIQKFSIKSIVVASAALVLVTTGVTYAYLSSTAQPNLQTLQQIRNELGNSDYPDTDKYEQFVKQFSALEAAAIVPFNDTTIHTDEELANKLSAVSEPKWQEAVALMEHVKTLNLSPETRVKLQALDSYTHQRLEEISIIKKVGSGDEKAIQELNSLRTRMKAAVDSLQSL